MSGRSLKPVFTKGVLDMKNHLLICKFIIAMLSVGALNAQAEAPFNLDLNPQMENSECEPGNPNATQLFACCVQAAKTIEVDSRNVLHLKADPNLCKEASLQNLEFALAQARPDGIDIFELKSPRIEDTVFRSYSGSPARLWIAVNYAFSFPQHVYPRNGVHPFVLMPLAIEHGTNLVFRTQLESVLGWKYLSQKILSERTENYDCSDRFNNNRVCTRTITSIEQSWLNQLTGNIELVVRELRK